VPGLRAWPPHPQSVSVEQLLRPAWKALLAVEGDVRPSRLARVYRESGGFGLPGEDALADLEGARNEDGMLADPRARLLVLALKLGVELGRRLAARETA